MGIWDAIAQPMQGALRWAGSKHQPRLLCISDLSESFLQAPTLPSLGCGTCLWYHQGLVALGCDGTEVWWHVGTMRGGCEARRLDGGCMGAGQLLSITHSSALQDLWLPPALHRRLQHQPRGSPEAAREVLEHPCHPAPLLPSQGLLCLRVAHAASLVSVPTQLCCPGRAQPCAHHSQHCAPAAAGLGKRLQPKNLAGCLPDRDYSQRCLGNDGQNEL